MGGNEYRARRIQSLAIVLTILGVMFSGAVSATSIGPQSQIGPTDTDSVSGTDGDRLVSDVITVGKNGTYDRLQVAIDNADNGDTIQVASGEYYPVWIDKEVNLIGVDTGGGKPVISAGDVEQCIRIVRADNVRIDGFHLKGDNNQGIHFEDRPDEAVITNTTFDVEIGFVFAPDSDNHVIYANDFSDTHKVVASYANAIGELTIFWNSTEPVSYWWNGEKHSGNIGNFYDDSSDDSDGDGIAETPHKMNQYPWKNQDYHTLVDEPWKYFVEGVGTSQTGPTTTLTTAETTITTSEPSDTPTGEETTKTDTIDTSDTTVTTMDDSQEDTTVDTPTTPNRGFFSNSGDGPAFLDNIFNLTVLGFLLSVAGILQQMMGGR